MGFSLQEVGSANLDRADIERAFDAALLAWSVVSCGGGAPSFAYGRQSDVLCGVGFDRDGANANTVVFRDNGWPYKGSQNTLGYTTVTFVPATGEILGADIEINTAQNIITAGDSNVRYDLQSILTHELGHALGLSHSPEPDATMRTSYDEGSTDMRTLANDDRDALCFVYPPERSAICDLTPMGGFTTCRPPPTYPKAPSCAAVPPASPVSWGLLVLPWIALARRRFARRS